jgi:hypothetical protein
MVEPGAAVLDVVDQPPLAAAGELQAPDRGAVVDAEVPARPHLQRGVVRHAADPPVPLRLVHQLAVVGAAVRRGEAALELLGELLLVISRRSVAIASSFSAPVAV